MRFVLLFALFFINVAFASDSDLTNRYLETIKHDPSQLYSFVQQLPKGADLHNHLDGAVSPQQLIIYGSKDNLCIDNNDNAIYSKQCPAASLLKNIKPDSDKYHQIVKAWSMEDFDYQHMNSSQHFFDTFGKSHLTRAHHRGEMLAAIVVNAKKQNIDYLELMINPDDSIGANLADTMGSSDSFEAMYDSVNQANLAHDVNYVTTDVAHMEDTKNKLLKCNTNNPNTACQVKVNYLYQVVRDQPNKQFFANLIEAFQLVNTDPRVVGINIVGSESDNISMANNKTQMEMLAFLSKKYPQVKMSLHAGEMLAQPSRHMEYALTIAKANRIGHGTNILHEKNRQLVAAWMKRNDIPVEINLTSNEDILRISGAAHPFKYYLKQGIPITLSTDDQGILNTDLTQEYIKAITRYQLNYFQAKQIVRNGLTYSFLPGKSLWLNDQSTIYVPACQKTSPMNKLSSGTCYQYLMQNPKARMQWQLERELAVFEHNTASRASHLDKAI